MKPLLMMTIENIRKHGPCYDPEKFLSEEWTGTALDILDVSAAPANDRLWVVTRPNWIDTSILYQFSLRCMRQALATIVNPGLRVRIDIANEYFRLVPTIPNAVNLLSFIKQISLVTSNWPPNNQLRWARAYNSASSSDWNDAAFYCAWEAALAIAGTEALTTVAKPTGWGHVWDSVVASRDLVRENHVKHLIKMLREEL